MKLHNTTFIDLALTTNGTPFNTRTNKYPKINTNKSTGYQYFAYYNKDTKKTQIINLHRIVCETFHTKPNETDEFHVDHLDNNKQNNHPDNLKWVTRKENNARSTKARKENSRELQLTNIQMMDMINEYLTGNYTLTGITEYMNTKYNRKSLKPTYSRILKGDNGKKFWKHQSFELKNRIKEITLSNTHNKTWAK